MDRPDPALAEGRGGGERLPTATRRKSPEPVQASEEIEIRLIWRLPQKEHRKQPWSLGSLARSGTHHSTGGLAIKTAVRSARSLAPAAIAWQSKLGKRHP